MSTCKIIEVKLAFYVHSWNQVPAVLNMTVTRVLMIF